VEAAAILPTFYTNSSHLRRKASRGHLAIFGDTCGGYELEKERRFPTAKTPQVQTVSCAGLRSPQCDSVEHPLSRSAPSLQGVHLPSLLPFISMILGFELRASCLLGRCYLVSRNAPWPYFAFSYFLDTLSYILPWASLGPQSSHLCL
jgi:hypothetical protein